MADDVFQATFLVLVQSARKIQRSGSLSAWLHGTARNIGRRAISQRRTRCPQAVEVEMLPACEVDPFLELERSHERDVLDEELQQLPEIDRAPLVLFYLEERSQREIAELLEISVGASRSYVVGGRCGHRLGGDRSFGCTARYFGFIHTHTGCHGHDGRHTRCRWLDRSWSRRKGAGCHVSCK
jgi:RNA polymerase sigma-70 factor (ECF subfamily)